MATSPHPRERAAARPESAPHDRAPLTNDSPAELVDFLDELPKAPEPVRRKSRKKLVLIGAGQAHLQILEQWRHQPLRHVDLTLISPFPQAVDGGMLPAVMAGMLPAEQMTIDLAPLAEHCQATLIVDKVVGLDPETRTLELALHPEWKFDAASIDIEAANLREDLCQTHRVMVAVRPLPTFLSRFEHRLQELLLQYREAPGKEYLQLAVVGGGAAGVELALCLEERAHREGWHAEVLLIDRHPELLPGFAPRTVRIVRKMFLRRCIKTHLDSPVVDCDEDGPAELVLEDGRRIRVDLVIWAAGAAPPGLLRSYQLPRSPDGYLAVHSTLQSLADVPVFAAGDVAALEAGPLPGARGDTARQARVLWENLRRWFRREPLIDHEPQPELLTLLACGDGTAILNYYHWGLRSALVWQLKRWLDRRAIRRFR